MSTDVHSTKLGNLTKAEAVYREARWRILSGDLAPGTPVNQAELATEFGVSPTPIREALRRLESEGLVVFVAHAMVMVSPLDLRELDELYAVRVELDSMAGRLAAQHRTDEDVALLRELLAPAPDAALLGRFGRNREFHRAVYSASGNQQLTALLDQLWDRTERYRAVLVAREANEHGDRYERAHSDSDHRALATAVIKRDAERVAALMRAHVQHSHDTIKEMLDGAR